MPQHTLAPPLTSRDLSACCGQWTYDGLHLGVSLRDSPPLERAEIVRRLIGLGETRFSPRLESVLMEWEDEYNRFRYYESEDEDSDPEPILDYSYKPQWRFHPELEPSPDNVFMGMEMEVECQGGWGDVENGATFARDALYDPEPECHGILKTDASLNNGFEIVTQPMTYQYGIGNWPWQILDTLREDHSFSARDNAGIHIHVARKSFTSPGHIYRWLTFLYRNPEPIQALARRGSVHYSTWDDSFRSKAVKYAKGSRDSQRYVAVNTQNPHTLEARFFRSTLKPQEAQAALGLIDSTVMYTRHLDVPSIVRDSGWGWQAYADWLASEGQWKPLEAEVEERVKPLPKPEQSVRPRRPKLPRLGRYDTRYPLCEFDAPSDPAYCLRCMNYHRNLNPF